MINIQFTVPVPVKPWSYLKFNMGPRRPEEQFSQDLKVFQKTLGECGLGFDGPLRFQRHEADLSHDETRNDEVISQLLKLAVGNSSAKILLIILPNTNAFTYARIKYWADVVYGKLS